VIQKAHIGRGFRGVLNYVFDESAERGHDAARILDTNMAGRNPRELAAEFGALRQLNPDLTRAVYHCSLRLPAHESLSDEGWAGFSRDYLREMGFGETPYVVVQHAGDHVHLIASRIRFDGQTVPDGNDRWRSNGVVYGLEEKYHLSHARDPERARERGPAVALDGGEAALAARMDEVPPKLRVAVRIDLAVAGCDGTREGFDEALCGLGVEAQWNMARTGRVHGASFALAGYTGEMQAAFKGSQLGKEYAWGRLSARLDARREEQGQGQGQERERGREEEQARTESSGGRSDGRGAREADREPARREQERASVAQGGRDRTREAMRGQLAAMGCREYEVGVHDPVRGMLTRRGSAAEIEARVGWLRAMNARGADIFVRPAEPGGLVLVDDVGREALGRMVADGLPPAVVTETSRDNHQAWVRLAEGPMTRAVGTESARGLAGRYGGDPRSAEAGHYGRLAGFTNRKPEHARADGRQPYVLLREAQGGCAPAGEAALARAGARVAIREGVAKAAREAEAFSRAGGGGVSGERLAAEYRERAARLCTRYPDADRSRVDWTVTRDLAVAYPSADAAALTAALQAGSPDLTERKGGHVEDYVARTVGKVLALPEVVAARQGMRARDDDRSDR